MLYIISLHVISHLRKTKWKRGEVMRQNASKGASPWLGSCMICIKWSCVMHQGPKKCIIVCGLGLAMHQFPQLKPPWFTNMPLFGEFETQCYMRCVWGYQRVGVFLWQWFYLIMPHVPCIFLGSSLMFLMGVIFSMARFPHHAGNRACLSSCSGMARALAATILVSNKQLIKEKTNY